MPFGNLFRAGKTIMRERKKQKRLRGQIAQRQAYNRIQRGQKVSPSQRNDAAGFIARGKPRIKW